MTRLVDPRPLVAALVAGVCGLASAPAPAVAADDAQLWAVARADRHLTKRWAGQVLTRFRFDDDISQAKDFMLRTFLHSQVGPFDLGMGYDYLYSFVDSTTSESRPFQRAEHRWQPERFRDLSVKNSLRLDERFLTGVEGVILRLRYRLLFSRAIGSRWSASLRNEVFANLNEQSSGPRKGFDQNRLALVFGRNIVTGVRAELGFEWQISENAGGPNTNNYVLLVNLAVAPKEFRAGRGD